MVYYQLDTILRMTQTDTDRAWAYFEWRLKSQWQCNVYEDLDIQWGVQIVSADMNIPNTWQPQQPQFSANVAAVARSNHNFTRLAAGASGQCSPGQTPAPEPGPSPV